MTSAPGAFGDFHLLVLFIHLAAEELGERGVGTLALDHGIGARRFPIRKIDRAKDIDAALDGAGLIQAVADIEFAIHATAGWSVVTRASVRIGRCAWPFTA